MEDRIELPPEPGSAAVARRWTDDRVVPVEGRQVADTVAQLVSELVSNVVLHAQTPCEVLLRRSGGVLRVAVRDGDHRLPRRTIQTESMALSGRGLVLIEALSDAHGVDRPLEGGKSVWFEIRADAAGPP